MTRENINKPLSNWTHFGHIHNFSFPRNGKTRTLFFSLFHPLFSTSHYLRFAIKDRRLEFYTGR